MKRPEDINRVEQYPVGTVSAHEHKKEVKAAKKKGVAKGSLLMLLLVGIVAGVTYVVSGFGNQYQYELLEPDYNLPELREDIIKEEGSIDDGATDVEKYSE